MFSHIAKPWKSWDEEILRILKKSYECSCEKHGIVVNLKSQEITGFLTCENHGFLETLSLNLNKNAKTLENDGLLISKRGKVGNSLDFSILQIKYDVVKFHSKTPLFMGDHLEKVGIMLPGLL